MDVSLTSTDCAVVAVGDTEFANFRLVLIIGRESNGSAQLVPGISLYDETISSGSAFWNRAYGFVQRAVHWPGNLREACVRARISPILFTNALPRPILNSTQNKGVLRSAVTEAEIRAHIRGVFQLPVADRIRMVIFSTGGNPVFSFPREEIIATCRERSISFVEMPYFATQGRPNAHLDENIGGEDLSTLQAIIAEYRAYVQQVVQHNGFAEH